MPSLVMTLIGKDRPGLVETLAEIVARHQANWLESRMAHLAGQFAGILLVDVPGNQADSLVRALQCLDQQGLTVIVQRDSEVETDDQFSPLLLEVVGNDRPGIVRQVSHVLSEHKVNVEDFRTHCSSAPMTGGKLFEATAQLRLPPGLSRDELLRQLETIAHDLMVDIRLAEAD